MRGFKGFVGVIFALMTIVSSASADDVALVLGDRAMSNFGNSWSRGEARIFSEQFDRAGFVVVEPRSRSVEDMLDAAGQVDSMLNRGNVDRLAIVILGPFAHNNRDNWALSDNAGHVTDMSVGAAGLSFNALSAMAARADRSVVIIGTGWQSPSVGTGISAGFGTIEPVNGVTYIGGETRPVGNFVRNQLLDSQNSLADLVQAAPTGINVFGYVAGHVGFMGNGGSGGNQSAAVEDGYWAAVRDIDTVEGYRLYLRTYPQGVNRKEARKRIKVLNNTVPVQDAEAIEAALNLSRQDRKQIQKNLKVLGFDPRGIDGHFGGGSRKAIANWQRTNRFDVTGFMTGNQMFVLRDQADDKRDELAAAQKDEERKDRAYWRITGRKGTEAGYRAYLQRYPDGLFSDTARQRLEEIEESKLEAQDHAAWQSALAGNTPAHYQSYLDRFPNGLYRQQAQQRLDAFGPAGPTAAQIAQDKAEERNVATMGVTRLIIEQRLAQLGMSPGKVDGRFDSLSREAIRRFQRSYNLPMTGFVSKRTMAKLLGG